MTHNYNWTIFYLKNNKRETKIYYNLIIAMFFDVPVSLSNFNKLTKKEFLLPVCRLPCLWRSYISVTIF